MEERVSPKIEIFRVNGGNTICVSDEEKLLIVDAGSCSDQNLKEDVKKQIKKMAILKNVILIITP